MIRLPTLIFFRICTLPRVTRPVIFGRFVERLLVQHRHASASSKTKVRKLLSELPKQATGVDGKPLPSLPPFETEPQPKKRRSRSSSDTDKDTAWKEAIASGEFPDTALAQELWENMRRYPDDLILTRVGMFYESYFAQAPLLATLLQIRLTAKKFASPSLSPSKSKSSTTSFPFAGFPISQRDKYFGLLLSLGRSVVIVEEKDPHDGRPGGKSKGEAKDRFVARKLTPGTLMVENWSSMDDNRYLMAISMGSPSKDVGEGDDEVSRTPVGVAYIDISTDRALITKTSTLGELEHDLARLSPVEVVLDSTMREKTSTDEAKSALMSHINASGIFVSYLPEQPIRPAHQSLPPLEGSAASFAQQHLENCLMEFMPVLMPPNHQSSTAYMKIDASTLLSLEIRQTIRHEAGSPQGSYHSSAVSRAGTLLSVIKRTLTPSGTRLLVNSLCQPSAHAPTIIARHDLVEAFVTRSSLREDLREKLRNMMLASAGGAGSGISGGSRGDLGRIVQRFLGWKQDSQAAFGSGVGFGRDLWDLKSAIEGMSWVVERIRVELERWEGDSLARTRLAAFIGDFRHLDDLARTIDDAVVESALVGAASEEDEQDSMSSDGSVALSEDMPLSKAAQQAAERDAMWWIKPTASDELNELHELNDALLRRKDVMERGLQSRYNSPKLMLRNNNMGYHVHAKADQSALFAKDPAFISISSTKSTRAYMYNEWTALGSELYNMSDRILAAQRRAFERLRKIVCDREEDLTSNAALMSELDLTMGFAQAALELRLVRPVINDGLTLNIINGRHPTVEHGLTSSLSPRNFIPNSLTLSPTSHLLIITGPNMGGKSTVLRQTAIIAILAQAGCYVPADKAEVGVVDRVFSRVGARDDLFMDRSTFMVEMHETAYILRRATPRSLVIMDEIGRGTTLQSGISIAFATLDHILRHIGCRTLFATHYHELADMLSVDGKPVKGVEFWSTDVDELDNRFSYSYKLKPGINRHSHAIKVARQAGMPTSFLQVAERTLTALEAGTASSSVEPSSL